MTFANANRPSTFVVSMRCVAFSALAAEAARAMAASVTGHARERPAPAVVADLPGDAFLPGGRGRHIFVPLACAAPGRGTAALNVQACDQQLARPVEQVAASCTSLSFGAFRETVFNSE